MTPSRRILAAAIVAVSLAGCPGDDHEQPLPDGPPSFKVMTQNLYLGAGLDSALSPSVDLEQLAEQIFASAQATDFTARAKLVADAIQSNDVDLVALQEAALWRRQVPGDGSFIPNATEVVQDFLDILVRELASRGLDYYVAAVNQNGDAELHGTSGNDYRLTDRDAILAKTSLPIVSPPMRGTYANLFTVQAPPLTPGGQPVTIPLARGWVAVDFRSAGRTIRLLDTHLEALSTDFAALQAAEAIAAARTSQQPTIVAGDMNLTPGSAGYDVFVAPGTGLADEWVEAGGSGSALTCCWNPDLLGGALSVRIDLEFATAQLAGADPLIVDDTPTTTSPPGLHASDHAGVVLGFTVQP